MHIKLNNINFSYKDGDNRKEIFKNFSYEIESGKLVMILGPSGCGKSTLLNIIGGLLQPENGEVIFGNTSYYSLKQKERDKFRKYNIGYIFQNFYLIEDLSPIDNVLISMPDKRSISEKEKYIKSILEELGIAEKTDSPLNTFSGGEQQRLAIARALARDAKLLICDEPTGSLDEINAIQIIEILKKISQQGKTVIVVTHNASLCEYADEVLELTKEVREKEGEHATDH
ncbi:MAG: ABC transporter ATP-binding protein [Lachnospiraceae bacterium]|nr:ABC transporter ATP-binding protein [Lachnospiraceae bacterium]